MTHIGSQFESYLTAIRKYNFFLTHTTRSFHVYGNDFISRCDRAEHHHLTFPTTSKPSISTLHSLLDLAASVHSPVPVVMQMN
ncbi:hypothetical protein RIF29_20217 [Crotalaria pallida]|uniref:Uncharacterized protein n=1 Tax=Crotalaria pallida TaxID=3830 RepID=A0AAN9F425_CROPI